MLVALVLEALVLVALVLIAPVLIALVLLAPVLPDTGADCTVTDPTDAASTGAN